MKYYNDLKSYVHDLSWRLESLAARATTARYAVEQMVNSSPANGAGTQSFERDIKQDLFYHGKTLICVILGCFFSPPKATSWIHLR